MTNKDNRLQRMNEFDEKFIGEDGWFKSEISPFMIRDFYEQKLKEQKEEFVKEIEKKIKLLELESGKQDGTNTKAIGIRINELKWVLTKLK